MCINSYKYRCMYIYMSNFLKFLTFTVLLHIYGSEIFSYLRQANIYKILFQ